MLQECVENAEATNFGRFLEKLRRYLNAEGVMAPAESARSALREFLASVLPADSTILVCSFNCPVVGEAIVKAGHRTETFDLASPDGRIDWPGVSRLLGGAVRAVVVPHLFGVPTDFRPILAAAKAEGVLIVEDCAHTLGGKIGDSSAGVVGDAAVFSFNYDKPLCLGGGGALLLNNREVADRYVANTRVDAPFDDIEKERRTLEQFLNRMERRRRNITRCTVFDRLVARVVNRAGLHRSDLGVQLAGFGAARAALGEWQLQRLPEIVAARNKRSAILTDALRDAVAGSTWYRDPAVTPAWLRQRVLLNSGVNVDRVSQKLQRSGWRVGRFNWPTTIDESLGRLVSSNASAAARFGVDVPIHQNMNPAEVEQIGSTLVKHAR